MGGIMWVNGGKKIKVEDERPTINSCCLSFFAVHSDIFTLRNGVSLVINTASALGNEKKIGNENKIIARIRFSKIDELEDKFGKSNLPEMHGGDSRPPTEQWVQERLRNFPLMDLPAYKANAE